MRKFLHNKLLMMPLIIVLTASAALCLFAPRATYSVNKKFEFKAVKYCLTMPLWQIFRKILDSITIFGIPVGKAIPLKCACGKDEYTYDSNLVWFATKQPQLDTEKQLKDAVEKMKEIVKQQKAMVKTGSPEDLDVFMNVYRTLRKTLQAANALAYSTNFNADFTKRFPEYSGLNNMTDVERKAAEAWKELMDGLMKAMNVTARNFDEEQQVRDALMNRILQTYTGAVTDGQTYVIQCLTATAAQGNAIIDRTGEELALALESCVSCQEIDRSMQEAVRKNVTAIAGNAAQSQPTAGSYNLGF